MNYLQASARPNHNRHCYQPLKPNESPDCGSYVNELGISVLLEKTFLACNPGYIQGRPCFYVGMSSHSPEERALQHLQGTKNVSRIAHTYGLRLRMDLVKNLKRVRRTWAMRYERQLARELRSQGYGVWQA